MLLPFRGFVSFLALVRLACAEPVSWQVDGAPWRIALTAGNKPGVPEAGWLIEMPEFGATRPDTRDVILFDDTGKEIALDPVWRSEGRNVLLLAQSMPPGKKPAMLYFGGGGRRFAAWKAEKSLLLETRRAPPGTDATSFQGLQSAWKAAPAIDGMGFVPHIFHGTNPYGDSRHFLSRFTGLLRVPEAGRRTFYTLSENQSYVVINGKPVAAWKENRASPRDRGAMPVGEINLPAGTVRVDYYHSMGERDHPGMVLGWKTGDTYGTIPPESWVQPGTTSPGPIEGKNGVPVPLATLEAASYLGYAGEWYAEVRARLPEAPAGWEIQWLWPDGKATAGAESTRLVFGLAPVRVRVRLHQGGRQLDGSRTLVIPRQVNAASVNKGDDIKRYLDLLAAEIPASLPEPARRAAFLLADDFASPEVAATWAAAWLADAKPAEGAWVRAQRVRLRWLARTDPAAALRTLRGLAAEARAAMKESYPRLELDLLVFGLQDPSVPAVVASLQKEPAAPLARFARIRLGDYHRLRGDTAAAAAAYQSATPAGADPRKAPVLDKAAALAIESLLEGKRAAEAREKAAEWEANRPLAKLESDFLFWQARVLALQGDWQAALKELESSARVRPSSPEEIDVLFWKARALHETNRRDQAREAWQAIVRDYPKHELAQVAREWLAK